MAYNKLISLENAVGKFIKTNKYPENKFVVMVVSVIEPDESSEYYASEYYSLEMVGVDFRGYFLPLQIEEGYLSDDNWIEASPREFNHQLKNCKYKQS